MRGRPKLKVETGRAPNQKSKLAGWTKDRDRLVRVEGRGRSVMAEGQNRLVLGRVSLSQSLDGMVQARVREGVKVMRGEGRDESSPWLKVEISRLNRRLRRVGSSRRLRQVDSGRRSKHVGLGWRSRRIDLDPKSGQTDLGRSSCQVVLC